MTGHQDGRRPEEATVLLEQSRELRDSSKALVARVLETKAHSQLLRERAEQARKTSDDVVHLSQELEQMVRAYAATLRQIGESPEQAVVSVKTIAFEAAQAIEHPLRIRPLDRQGLVNDLVRWTIAAYFDA